MWVLPQPVGPMSSRFDFLMRRLPAARLVLAALEVIVGRDGHRALGTLLADHMAIQVRDDLARRGQEFLGNSRRRLHRGGASHACADSAKVRV